MGRLFWKIFLWFWVSMVLLVIGTAWVIANLLDDPRFESSQERRWSRFVEPQIELVAMALEQGGAPLARRLLRRRHLPIQVFDAAGRELLDRVPPPSLAGAPSAPVISREVITPSGAHFTLQAAPSRREHRPPRRFGDALQRHLIGRAPGLVALRFAVAVLISGLLCFALAWYLTRPVVRLREATRRVSAGDLETRVGDRIGKRWDEFADLGREFDQMVERLRELVASQKRLLNDVSHEIRTPLARLRVAVELQRRKQGDAPGRELERIEREVDRLDRLVGRILTLSRLEAGSRQSSVGSVNLTLLLGELLEDLRFEAPARQIAFDAPDSMAVRGDRELLGSALENILRNAITHTPDGSPVSIAARKSAGRVRLEICDQGPGVPESLLPRLFEPFVRVEGSNEGYGLGLAIARRSIEAMGGGVSAHNREPAGLCVVVDLPCDPAGAAQASM